MTGPFVTAIMDRLTGIHAISSTPGRSLIAVDAGSSGEKAMRHIYLAGPEVFLPDAIGIGERKKGLCRQHGFVGLFPFDNEVPTVASTEGIDRTIYRANVAMMLLADLAIVNLTPFRGPSADVGSVFELGMIVGLGKPVLGYTNVISSLAERIETHIPGTARDGAGVLRDPGGMSVEDFDNADNLMIDCSLLASGHPIVRVEVGDPNLFNDLRGFETCLRLAASMT